MEAKSQSDEKYEGMGSVIPIKFAQKQIMKIVRFELLAVVGESCFFQERKKSLQYFSHLTNRLDTEIRKNPNLKKNFFLLPCKIGFQ
jgi:hypothetical protein